MTYNVFGGTLNPAQSNPIQPMPVIITRSLTGVATPILM